MDPVTRQSSSDQISVELSSRRTGMSFQRTRMSEDRTLMSVIRTSLSLISFGFTIFQVFEKLKEAGTLAHAGAPRNFGITLVELGIIMLVGGIIYHLQFMLHLRQQREAMIADGLVHGESQFPVSLTLLTAVILLMIGVAAIVSMVFNVGPCGRTYKNHIDGYNLVPYLTGKEKESPRKLFVYISDDGDIIALRYDNWKCVFMEQRCNGTMQVWAEPFTRLRIPKLFNLRTDPYERADVTSNTYYDWFLHNAYFIYVAQAGAAKVVESFKDFPPAQKPGTFTIDQAMAKMSELPSGD